MIHDILLFKNISKLKGCVKIGNNSYKKTHKRIKKYNP